MELRGKAVEKMPKKKREKMENTLKKMEETRLIEYQKLRDKVDRKLDWALSEKEKGEGLVKEHKERLRILEAQLLRLDGAIKTLKELKG